MGLNNAIPDTGNPNAFTTFRGKFDLTINEGVTAVKSYVVLSCTNNVTFLSAFTTTDYNTPEALFTLPAKCTPNNLTIIPIVLYCEYSVALPIDYTNNAIQIYTADDGLKIPLAQTQGYTTGILIINTDGQAYLADSYKGDITLYLNGVNYNVSSNYY